MINSKFAIMKKLFTGILAFIYLGTSTGIALNVHYCMGKFSSVELFHHDKCGKCGMQTAKGCCKDEVKIVKLSDTHKVVSNDVNIFSPSIIINTCYQDHEMYVAGNDLSISLQNNSPPASPVPLCIRNCVFRI